MIAGSTLRTLELPTSNWHWPGPGSCVIRGASPADADLIRDFVCALSPRSRYFRFFASACPPSTGLLRALSGAAGSADILLVTDRRGAVIGHGMAADARVADGFAETNIGLVISDEWQQRGLGSALLTILVSRAARRGVDALVLNVLPENDRMRGMIHRRWPGAAVEHTRDGLVLRPLIGPADARNPIRLPAAIDLRPRTASSPPASAMTPPAASKHAGGNRVPDLSAA